MKEKILSGRYDENRLKVGDRIRIVGDTSFYQDVYPIGQIRTIEESFAGLPNLKDNYENNGLNAKYVLLPHFTRFADFMRRLDEL